MAKNFENSDLEQLDSSLNSTVKKLDADQYMAEDLDGITESVFGSGNMAYASLQASQTDAALNNNGSAVLKNMPDNDLSNNATANISKNNNLNFEDDNSSFSNSNGDISSGFISNLQDLGGPNLSSTTLGSFGASKLFSDAGTFSQSGLGARLFGGDNNITSQQSNINNTENTTNVENITGDNIVNILDQNFIDITDVVTDISVEIFSVKKTILEKTSHLIDVDQTVNVVNDLIVDLTADLTQSLSEVTQITNNIFDFIHHGDNKEIISNISETLIKLKSITVLENAISDLGEAIEVTNSFIHDIAENIIEIKLNSVNLLFDKLEHALNNLHDNVFDVVGEIKGLLNVDNDNSDTDIGLDTGIDVVDHTLADVDLDVVIDPVEDIIGDIDNTIGLETDLLGTSETDNTNGDSDLTIDGDIDIVDVDIVDVDIPLDVVENITGDIDLDVSNAIDLFNADNIDNTPVNCEDNDWTESTIVADGLFDDFMNQTDGLGDALPDPVGTIAEGIGALDVEPDLDLGSIGGLFG